MTDTIHLGTMLVEDGTPSRGAADFFPRYIHHCEKQLAKCSRTPRSSHESRYLCARDTGGYRRQERLESDLQLLCRRVLIGPDPDGR
jgi:hypothetical protein